MKTMESANEAVAPGVPAVKEHPELVPKPQQKRGFVKPLIISGVLIGAAVGAAIWWQHASQFEETDDAFITGHVHQLSARVGGTVTRILVADNQHVQQGQLLLNIDPKDLQISLDTAKAAAAQAELKILEVKSNIEANAREAEASKYEADSAISSAKAGVDRAKFMLSETKLGVSMAQSDIKQRKAELMRASSDFERYKSLVSDRAATMQSFEKAKQDKEVAEANLHTAEEAHKQSLTRVQQAKQQVADAESSVVRAMGAAKSALAKTADTETTKRNLSVQDAAAQKARSEVANAATQLSYTNVVAPVKGRIGHRTVEVGQQIERGQALMSIVSDEKWVVANFKETQLKRMHVGQEVDIKIDAFPDRKVKGRIDSISPASGAQFALLPPDNATGNFTKVVQRIPVKIVFDKESLKELQPKLAPGMSVIPEVHVGR